MSILDLVYNSPFYVRATATWSSVLVTLLGGIVLLLAGIYLYVGPYKLYSSGFRDLKSESIVLLHSLDCLPPASAGSGWIAGG